MRMFIDCEWNGFAGDLISMALVAEDGSEWYEVLHCDEPVTWVAENVIPVLNKEPMAYPSFIASLQKFLFKFDSVEIVADWPEDIARFCSVLITSPGARIDTPDLRFEIIRVDAVSEIPHNALMDARGLKAALTTPSVTGHRR